MSHPFVEALERAEQLIAKRDVEIEGLRAERDELLAVLKEIKFHGGPAADHARAAIAKAEGK